MNPKDDFRGLALGLLLIAAGSWISGCGLFSDFDPLKVTHLTAPPAPRRPTLSAPRYARAVEGYTDTIRVRAYGHERVEVDLTHLPAGNDARFDTVSGGATSWLIWTPAAGDRGVYDVVFSATNAAGTSQATTSIYVRETLVDQPPRVTAPAETTIATGETLRIQVTAEDPDGDPIDTWTATYDHPYLYGMFKFTIGDPRSGATLLYTPTYADTVVFTFTATSFSAGSAETRVLIQDEPATASR